jgi:hypothetical protein
VTSVGCFICDPTNPRAVDEGCERCEASYVNQVVIPSGIETGNDTPDAWVDYDKVFAEFSRPYRGGVLSDRGRANPKITRERLRKDAQALLWTLHWACRDLVSARSWGAGLADQNRHYRDRLTELFGLLTDEQKAVMRARDDARHTAGPA